MIKSKRIQMLEMRVALLESNIKELDAVLKSIIEGISLPMPDLDAQKWYTKNTD